eukprot:m.316963 g.316963  ORF g.316963 m.316963 type:complete len:122 (+) comp23078_c0_seq4:1275-1640(+)
MTFVARDSNRLPGPPTPFLVDSSEVVYAASNNLFPGLLATLPLPSAIPHFFSVLKVAPQIAALLSGDHDVADCQTHIRWWSMRHCANEHKVLFAAHIPLNVQNSVQPAPGVTAPACSPCRL